MRVGDGCEEFLGDHFRVSGLRDFRQQHRELFTTMARHEIPVLRVALANQLRQLHQHVIADGVAVEPIVDPFEMIGVDQQQDNGRPGTAEQRVVLGKLSSKRRRLEKRGQKSWVARLSSSALAWVRAAVRCATVASSEGIGLLQLTFFSRAVIASSHRSTWPSWVISCQMFGRKCAGLIVLYAFGRASEFNRAAGTAPVVRRKPDRLNT